MEHQENDCFDVLIMGAGFAGICQARHLLLKVPGLKIAIVDPKGPDASERDLKVGESLVEISAMFLYRELELQEYLIENHPPKYGLNFHWPKTPERTESLTDYYHVWTNANPHLPSFQLNRAKFEADVLQMCIDMGVKYIQGKVTDVELNPLSEPNAATVKTRQGKLRLRAHHLVDAAARKFLISKKIDNRITDPEQLAGIETGSAWLRVDHVDRSIFQADRDPINGSSSHYYGTNHFFGHGHWIWMIPIEKESRCLSIGVVHHKEFIHGKSINTREKFLAFLKANHRIVYDLVTSGEPCDFKYLNQIAHKSKTMLSEDQWYVIGEAANMYDPFYSTGLVLAAHNIEGVTEVIRAKLSGADDAEDKRNNYELFIQQASDTYNHVFQDHGKHLGDAGIMSWRTYMESMFWFGILVPAYTGKWHMEPDFIQQFVKLSRRYFLDDDAFLTEFYKELSRSRDKGVNIGMLNYTRTDQLAFCYQPLKFWDSFRENSKYEHRRLNVFLGIRQTVFFLGLLYAKLRIKNSGYLGLLQPKTLKYLGLSAWWTVYTAMGEFLHKRQNRNRPNNSIMSAQDREFEENYVYRGELMPWSIDSEPEHSAESSPSAEKPELTTA